ncbi:MAG: hypothetical protein P8Z36_11815 [Gemmatimonadota bacterium]|jgi:hypothetical protein
MAAEATQAAPRPQKCHAGAGLRGVLSAAGTGEESLRAGLIASTDNTVFVVDAERRLSFTGAMDRRGAP